MNLNNSECPLCGERKRDPKHLVCATCYKSFTNHAGRSLAGGTVLPMPEWIKDRAVEKLEGLQEEFAGIEERYTALQQEVHDDAYAAIMETLKGTTVKHEVLMSALQTKKKELWAARRGNALHAQKKTLENRIDLLEGFVEGPERTAEPEEKAGSPAEKSVDPEVSESPDEDPES